MGVGCEKEVEKIGEISQFGAWLRAANYQKYLGKAGINLRQQQRVSKYSSQFKSLNPMITVTPKISPESFPKKITDPFVATFLGENIGTKMPTIEVVLDPIL